MDARLLEESGSHEPRKTGIFCRSFPGFLASRSNFFNRLFATVVIFPKKFATVKDRRYNGLSCQRMKTLFRPLLVALILGSRVATAAPPSVRLSDKEAGDIGRKVWRNECGGTVEGLTSWNAGENFASLGIGHFIWYPKGAAGPFEESFPKLVSHLKTRGASLPKWLDLDTKCPWSTRAEFQHDQKSARMTELRELLSSTLRLQAEFLVQRLENALPKMLAAAPSGHREKVRAQFQRVLQSGGAGAYALVDYVNFKGEGVLETERYRGEGWGLLQVLENMTGTGAAGRDFSNAAKEVLTRRVRNSPPERHEERWLSGWKIRVAGYAE